MTSTIKSIKQSLRLSMNGVASQRMRESGLNYKINFGVELPRLQTIADEHASDVHLALTLWQENIRECKILACMLMPEADFTPDLAEVWADQIPNIEIARLMVHYLLVRLPYATDLAFRWIATDHVWRQACGLLLATRLVMLGTQFSARSLDELRDQAQASVSSANTFVSQAAATLLGRIS